MIDYLWKDKMINLKQRRMLEGNLFKETEECLSDRNWIVEKNQLLSRIIETYESEIRISDRLKEAGVHSVAIYGLGECGYHLYKKLNTEGFRIFAFIDRANFRKADIPVYKCDETPKSIDCVINTLIRDKKEVDDYYKSNYPNIKVVHIRELLF